MNSSQSQVDVTASTWALASTNKWLDTGMEAARARPMTLSQPVMPPIFMRSGIMRSQAPALMAAGQLAFSGDVLALQRWLAEHQAPDPAFNVVVP